MQFLPHRKDPLVTSVCLSVRNPPRYPVCCRQSCLNPRVETNCHSLFLHSLPRFFRPSSLTFPFRCPCQGSSWEAAVVHAQHVPYPCPLWVGQRSFPCTGFFAALTNAHQRAVISSNVVILREATDRCAAPFVTRFRIASGFRNQFVFFIGLGD